MNRNAAILQGWQTATTILSLISKRCRVVPVVALLAIAPAIAQNSEMQEKLAAVKAVAAENKQQLRQYQWTETIQLTLKGDPKPPTSSLCQYGSDGQVQKTPIGAPPPEPSGGRLKQKIIAKKKAEIKGYMEQVKALLSIYVPPDPQRMQEAYQAGKFSLNPMPGVLRLVFTDYAQPGDRMSIAFDTTAKKITLLDVDTYLDEEKHAVTLHVQMATLPNGPNYAQKTVLNASAKELVVTTTNYSYQKLGGQ
ncbi:MAG TPA: hypothetical protein VJX70_02975 [Candidatus Acidoferrum sp.]|nr:hypothetical protein [Candidatus Acidoferrum sp.]